MCVFGGGVRDTSIRYDILGVPENMLGYGWVFKEKYEKIWKNMRSAGVMQLE